MTIHQADAGITQFDYNRLLAASRAVAATQATDISSLQRAQMRAVAGLAALTFHEIKGEPDRNDAIAVRNDIAEIAILVDAFLNEIFKAVKASAIQGFDFDEFKNPLEKQLDGNALYAVMEAFKQDHQEHEDWS